VLVRTRIDCCGGVPGISRSISIIPTSFTLGLTEHRQIRIYSREVALESGNIMHVQKLPAPIVLIAPSGEDSLLVYTYENILYHYVINVTDAAVTLVQVGQIALHGIIRAPPRVRALSWILPEDQIRESS
jgi:RAB6A-GEF complex partner protein 1